MKSVIRTIMKWTLASLLILSGSVKRAKKRALSGEYILSIFFHNPTVKEFEDCIRWLLKQNFHFLSISDVKRLIENKTTLPSGGVLITVDDGWALNEEAVVKIVDKYKIPVGIFIATEAIEEGTFWWSYVDEARRQALIKYSKNDLKLLDNEARLSIVNDIKHKLTIPRQALTIKQVKSISQSPYITIGGHTHTHPILNKCKVDQVYNELLLSKGKLESWIGKEVEYFAYPNGNYSEREIAILIETNYQLAFTNEPHYITPEYLQWKYKLPRFEIYQGNSFAENICRMVGLWQPLINRIATTLKFN